jgi:hypothetical protein
MDPPTHPPPPPHPPRRTYNSHRLQVGPHPPTAPRLRRHRRGPASAARAPAAQRGSRWPPPACPPPAPRPRRVAGPAPARCRSQTPTAPRTPPSAPWCNPAAGEAPRFRAEACGGGEGQVGPSGVLAAAAAWCTHILPLCPTTPPLPCDQRKPPGLAARARLSVGPPRVILREPSLLR